VTGIEISGVPLEFLVFGATLLGVALFHDRTLQVAATGLAAIVVYKLFVTGFHGQAGAAGLLAHLQAEWVVLANLFALLMGFALLSRHFEQSHVPGHLPRLLPDDWKGGFVLLVLVFVLSSFLDNIAAALIGGTVAASVFHRRLHIGYVAAIVAASNAGGSGSVVGDTTTTMMWIDGVSPRDVLHAYVAAGVALVVCGVCASRQQQAFSPIQQNDEERAAVDWPRVAVVACILLAAIGINVLTNMLYPQLSARFPFIGAAVWAALLVCAIWRRPDWSVLPSTLRGTLFLLCLVLAASLMPVERLPAASWQTAFGLGFVSAVFDNIPLTKLALEQGGYDWGMLAYTVGFGGSMIWFGSSAGVAITNLFPEARSVGGWLKGGWHVALAYVAGFAALMFTLGWQPHAPHRAAPLPLAREIWHSPGEGASPLPPAGEVGRSPGEGASPLPLAGEVGRSPGEGLAVKKVP
jgi:Na+/H+ antiporter NhaD/arsenite permease-like protein